MHDHTEIWEKEFYAFLRFPEESITQERVRNHSCLIDGKVVLIPNEQIPRKIYPAFEMTQDRTCPVHLSVVISGDGIRVDFFFFETFLHFQHYL